MLEVAGRPVEVGREPRLFYAGVTAHHLQALGTPLLRGRLFTDDEGQRRSGVAVIDVSTARVLSYSVSQRAQEFAVRMALGAEPGDVRRMMIGQGLRRAAWGIGFGVLGAFAVTRLIARLLYNVTPTDPASFALVALRSE